MKSEVTKTNVESYIINLASNLAIETNDDEDLDIDEDIDIKAEEAIDGPLSDQQLSTVKTALTPLLPVIRFTLIDADKYSSVIETFSFFLSKRQTGNIQRFFSRPENGLKDKPRGMIDKVFRSKIVNQTSWRTLRMWIFDTNKFEGCHSPMDLRFKLLYRATKDSFAATAFHKNCDQKGPTIVLIKSSDGHLFGGVNFAHWTSNDTWSNSTGGFLFALNDGKHRKKASIFPNSIPTSSTYNGMATGPQFGQDLFIADNSNTNNSSSSLPQSYNGGDASKVSFAGKETFLVADYEVYGISKK